LAGSGKNARTRFSADFPASRSRSEIRSVRTNNRFSSPKPQGAPATHPTPERILQLGTGFFASRTVLSATELGVFTELDAGPLDGETLRARLKLHPRGSQDFFDALVALGLLKRKRGLYSTKCHSWRTGPFVPFTIFRNRHMH
jgi:hypothetical protein